MAEIKEKTSEEIIIKRTIHAKREEVWEAWTSPQIMGKWFFPMEGWSSVVENDLRVGGQYKLTMNCHGIESDCEVEKMPQQSVVHTGEYKVIDQPKKLVFTWNSDFVKDTEVTVELKESGQDTDLTLTHRFLPDAEARSKHASGWEGCLSSLEKHIK